MGEEAMRTIIVVFMFLQQHSSLLAIRFVILFFYPAVTLLFQHRRPSKLPLGTLGWFPHFGKNLSFLAPRLSSSSGMARYLNAMYIGAPTIVSIAKDDGIGDDSGSSAFFLDDLCKIVVIEEIDGPNGDGLGRAATESGFEYESEQESESNIDVEVSGVEENVDSGVHDFAARFPFDEGDNEEVHSDHVASDELISIDGSSDDGDSRRRTFYNRHATSRWLYKKYVERIRSNPSWPIDSFEEDVRLDYIVGVSRSQLHRAKRKAMLMIHGSHKEQYAKLWDYCQEIKRTNPGSTVELKVSHEDGENGQPRPRTHATKHKKSKAIDQEGPPSRGLTTRVYCPGKSPMNFDVDAMSDVYRAEIGNIHEYTYPDVNLGEDTDKHFSYPTNEVVSETNASPEDYNDDIDFNEDLDDVLNQDESDSDRNNAGTSHDSVRCVNGLSY
ncbi:hypothetical protein MRB53_023395 [Persea americana]|uniref:Uncharacterized protein n=1 Tax=Persea americana TaxID=3435 RepID=A0ACC2L9A3_PERAE|nr:hypothetical protein MRB53_023395 [Persea americana]